MRHAVLCLAAAAVAGCSPGPGEAAGDAPSAAAPVAAMAPRPKPRVGVWETAMVMPAGATGQSIRVVSQVCLDEASLKDDAWTPGGTPPGGAAPDCTQEFQQSAGGYSFTSVCKTAQGTSSTSGVARGDFNSAYSMDMTTKMEPAPSGVPPETKMTVDARWVGPCAPGQKAGMVGAPKMTPVAAG
jgi:hypothetical protein